MRHKFGRSGPRAKKAFGQNFLTDDSAVRRIVAAVQAGPGDNVVEIGPGRGALTGMLLETGANVTAIEIDRDLHPLLRAEFGSHPRFRLIADDVLQVDLEALLSGIGGGPVKIIGNLPYNISTPILESVSIARHHCERAVFMFQREVVERITARGGDSERGYFTVLVEAAFECERLFDVAPESFYPRPKVWSSIARLTPKAASPADEPRFRRLVSMAFAQKRKTLRNNLRSVVPDAEAAFTAAAIDAGRRAETLTLDEWLKLYAAVERAS
ncbi:MAG: 16S rRNA (adenine(1518)-N(6)/adenine(1519)-N(6))-dimethyltransferase RsmA [Pyrinomonadaceae bacterium]|nr:16S rRNA (adenine(1518)-N(6)/adenine(1519)-N(6))-dimethyltransferase RsmA [Pyrinomonadaceae bacterium]